MAEIMSYPLNLEEYIGAETVMLWHYGRTSGVFGAENNLLVTSVNNSMDITISDGTAWLTDGGEHSIVFHNSTESSTGNKEKLTVSIADGTLNRIDRIIIKWYLPQFSTKPTLEILKGTPSSSATAPALTNNDTYREISLAQISIPAGTTTLTAANITDERLDPTVCGIVTSDVEIPTQAIQNQAKSILENLNSEINQTVTDLNASVNQTLQDLDTTVDTTVAEITADAESLINQIENDLDQVLAGGLPDNIVTTSKIADGAVTTGKINGLTATIAELNYTDGVTSNIQTQLDNKAITETYTTTLNTTWIGDSAPYTQTQTISGILETDNPIVDVVLSNTTETAQQQLEAYTYISKITTSANSITVTCLEDKPTIAIPLQLKVVR